MKINANRVCPDKSFYITGVSYIGKPKSNTVMYVTKKVEHLIAELNDKTECLVFAEESIAVSKALREKHGFVFDKNPQLAYVRFVSQIDEEIQAELRKIPYNLRDGSYISETAVIGENVYIEPGCVIGPGVTIGDNVTILAGTKIRRTNIKNNVFINENVIIGTNAFFMVEDENGNLIRAATLGDVLICDNVEIGASSSIEAGCAGSTIIKEYAKLDTAVVIGHDSIIESNSKIVGGTVVGGFVTIGEKSSIGIGCHIKNRVSLGSNTVVGLGTAVIRDVEPGAVVAGVPARKLR